MAQSNEIEYELDGRRLIGHLAVPDGTGASPGVLVCHEGPGLTDHAIARADRLAELGYVAFALDYHGEGKPIADRDEMMVRLGGLMNDPDQTRALAAAGLAVLTGHTRTDGARLAAIGFCFGGTMALELARSGAELGAVVGFHSGLATTRPGDAVNIRAKVLVCIGADDPMIPPAQREAFEQEMRAGAVDWRMNLYGGAVHSFTNPDAGRHGMAGIAYHQPTDERSWRAMLDLFDEAFA
jgi:dienelactone hydrolase